MFYYYPAQALEALVDVIKHFAMPGVAIIPDFARFEEIVARAAVFGSREYATDVLQVALQNLGVKANRPSCAASGNRARCPIPTGTCATPRCSRRSTTRRSRAMCAGCTRTRPLRARNRAGHGRSDPHGLERVARGAGGGGGVAGRE